MILAFTDFGFPGPYLGEMRAAALRLAPDVPYVDLMVDAPACRPDLAAYLLAAYSRRLWRGDVVIAVVDPGVGTARAPVAVRVDQTWFVGPDNGLFELILRREPKAATFAITYRPKELSESFHGRDIFAPMAGRLAAGNPAGRVPGQVAGQAPGHFAGQGVAQSAGLRATEPTRFPDWPDDLDRIVHVDGFGNLVTGRRAATVAPGTVLMQGEQRIRHARVFGDVPPGTLFWYENSAGLLEIAQNGGSAAAALGLAIGDAAPVATSAATA